MSKLKKMKNLRDNKKWIEQLDFKWRNLNKPKKMKNLPGSKKQRRQGGMQQSKNEEQSWSRSKFQRLLQSQIEKNVLEKRKRQTCY